MRHNHIPILGLMLLSMCLVREVNANLDLEPISPHVVADLSELGWLNAGTSRTGITLNRRSQLDSPILPLRLDGGKQYWLATFFDPVGIMYSAKFSGPVERPLETLVSIKPANALFNRLNKCSLARTDGGNYWIANLYQHDENGDGDYTDYAEGDGILAFVHVNRADGSPNPDGTLADGGWTRLGLGWSDNGGESFTYLGHVITQVNNVAGTQINGMPYLIKDGYFYVYFRDTNMKDGKLVAGTSVARASVAKTIERARYIHKYIKAKPPWPWEKFTGEFKKTAGKSNGSFSDIKWVTQAVPLYQKDWWTDPETKYPGTKSTTIRLLNGKEIGGAVSDVISTNVDGTTQYWMAESAYSRNHDIPNTRIRLFTSMDGLIWWLADTAEYRDYEEVGGATAERAHAGGYFYVSLFDPEDGVKDGSATDHFDMFAIKDYPTVNLEKVDNQWVSIATPTDTVYRYQYDLRNQYQVYRAKDDFSGDDSRWQYYGDKNGTKIEMNWAGGRFFWDGPGSLNIFQDKAYPTFGGNAIRSWTAPYTGYVAISAVMADVQGGGGDGVTGRIKRQVGTANPSLLWSGSINNGDTGGVGTPVALRVHGGDKILFELSSNNDQNYDMTWWEPTVYYTDGYWRASSDFSTTQKGRWSYLYGSYNDAFSMIYIGINTWRGSERYLNIGTNWMHPGDHYNARRRWIAPFTGTIRIQGTIKDLNGNCGDGVKGRIEKNGVLLLNQPIVVPNGDYAGRSHNLVKHVNAGDAIDFVVNRNGTSYCDKTGWDPVIRYL